MPALSIRCVFVLGYVFVFTRIMFCNLDFLPALCLSDLYLYLYMYLFSHGPHLLLCSYAGFVSIRSVFVYVFVFVHTDNF